MKYARTIAKSNGTRRLVLRYVRTIVTGEGKINARNHIRKEEEKKKKPPPGKKLRRKQNLLRQIYKRRKDEGYISQEHEEKKKKKKEMHCIVIRIDRPTFQTDAGWQRQKKVQKKY